MKLYLGAPFAHLEKTSPGYALAHEMGNDKIIDQYREYGDLILDNGADELGEGQSGHRLTYLAGRLEPHVLILPDILHNDKKTKKRGKKYLTKVRQAGYKGRVMAVVQATTYDDFVDSYFDWMEEGIDYIGVTYDTQIVISQSEQRINPWSNRITLLEQFSNNFSFLEGTVHLLGTLEVKELYHLMRDDRYEGVRLLVGSHDTTAPWACDTRFRTDDGIHFGRNKNWKAQDFHSRFEGERLKVAYWNVACYLTACKIPFVEWKNYMPQDQADYYYYRLSDLYV
jgi:hypothetical protein